MGVWQERAGRNEALFREVNENIVELEERLQTGDDFLPIVCECAHPKCTTRIQIGRDAYAHVRRHPGRFIVAPGHEELSVEQVVEEHSGYVIVEKHGIAAAAADAAS